MFTLVDNKVYVVEGSKMFPVNISRENGIEKAGQAKDLPKGYQVYTINEIFVKFNIQENKPYYFDKEKYEQELAEAKAKAEAELREEIKAEVRAELEAEAKEGQTKPNEAKTEGNKPNNK
ncbi:MAG: hypothetical protein HFJ30_00055 [Clostridia bacterium]|jgi:hypothetical protein|nr:hypothetical protein [Clostridia bacterium]MCI9412967.1 hypothetical protein [Clostridia bacterium]